MPLLWSIPFILLLLLSVGGAVYYGIIWWRIASTQRRLPTARHGLDAEAPAHGWGRVCVIVPAHNEEEVIATVARSLLSQDYADLRIVFSIDRCTDETARILRDAIGEDSRVETIEISECPEGWSGKTHAMWRGVQDSEGACDSEYLLFVDADTCLDPACIRATVALLRQRGLGLLSLLPDLALSTWFERIVQPATGFELVRQFPLDLVNDPGKARAFANGQFMLFDRTAYFAFGGHEKIRRAVLEDIAIATVMPMERHGGGRIGVLLADGMLGCRMYSSWDAFRRGWKRIYMECAGRRPARLKRLARRQRFAGTLLPLCPLLAVLSGTAIVPFDRPLGVTMLGTGAVCALAVVGALRRIYSGQRLGISSIAGWPVGCWLTASILREAATDLVSGRETIWAGKSYTREAHA